MRKAVRDIKHYRKNPTHKYVVIDYSRSAEVDGFFYTEEDAKEYFKDNNGKVVGASKKRLKIEETYYFKMWKKSKGIQ